MNRQSLKDETITTQVVSPASTRDSQRPVPISTTKHKQISIKTPDKTLRAIISLPNFRNPLIYLVGLAVAETLITFIHPQIGLWAHGVLLVALLVHGGLFARRAQKRFLVALSLLPLTRLLSLSLPLDNIPMIYWYATISAPLLIAAWLVMHLLGYTRQKIGLTTGSWRGLPLHLTIGATGFGFGYLESLLVQREPLVEALVLREVLLPTLILLIFTGFLEEFIFRGLLLRTSLETVGRYAIPYVSLLYAVFHLGYHSCLNFIFAFLVGMFFGYAVLRTRSLLGVSISHGLINVSIFLIYPFLG
jgi:uncharacterized protein